MNALWIAEFYPPSTGGVQIYLRNTVRHMSRIRSVVFTKELAGHPLEDQQAAAEESRLLRVAHWPEKDDVHIVYRQPGKLLRLYRDIRRVLREETISLVVVGKVSFPLLFVASLLKLTTRVPVAFLFHGEEIPAIALRSNPIRRALFKMADFYICNSHYTSEALSAFCHHSRPSFISCPGVEERFFEPADTAPLARRFATEGRRVIYTVGRLDPRKGHDRVIEALPALIDRIPNLLYLVGGTGRNLEPLKRRVKELGLEAHVRFCGFIADEEIVAFHQLGELFVMPNRTLADGDTEGFGIVFLEAGACGRPVIGGNCGGVPDAVRDCETGFLVDPYRSGELTERILYLLEHRAEAVRMGEAGRRRAWQEFRWPHLAGRLEGVLLEAAGH
ncbi:hypothetical protein GMSM_38640 [Geomonas sp. Red276]